MNEGQPYPTSKPTPLEQSKEISAPVVTESIETSPTQPGAQEIQTGKKKEWLSSAEGYRRDFDRLKGNNELDSEARIKEYRRLEQAVNDRRTDLQESTKAERSQLLEARVRLGMTQGSQESHSERAIAQELRDLDTLDSDIQNELREDRKADESLERERRIKESARYAGEAAIMFARELNNRDRDGMDPFMDAKAFNELRSGATTLSQFGESQGRVDMNELGLAFSRINSGLDRMERTRRSGPVRESEESLGKLGYAMQNLYEATSKMSKNFREGDERAAMGARRLMEISERIYGFTSRMRSTIRNMR